MSSSKPVAAVADIPEGGAVVVDFEGAPVAIFKVSGQIRAMHDTCPHRGASLAEGQLEDAVVTCPWHAWEFNVTTGECLTVPQARLKCYKVRIEGSSIFLET